MHHEVSFVCLFLGVLLVLGIRDEQHYINQAKSWKDAQEYCRGYYTDLATLKNIKDVDKLPILGNQAWIGLADDPASWKGVMTGDSNSWKWSSTGTTSPGGYQNFAPGEPNNYAAAEWCVLIDRDGWKDYFCNNGVEFVCYSVQAGIKQYHFIATQKSWADAQIYCRQHYLDLAMIETTTENQAVQDIVPSETSGWIGLSRLPFSWSDGNNSTYRLWASGEPTGWPEYCTYQKSTIIDYYWYDANCDQKNTFVCHGALKQASKLQTKLTLKTTANMADPAVKDKFLKALDDTLDRNGVNISLKWINPPTKEAKKTHPAGCS